MSGVQTTKLTDAIVCRLPYAASGQYVVRDAVVPGFFVVVGKKARTWTVQGDLRRGRERNSIRVSMGRCDEVSVRDARAQASDMLDRIRAGKDPRDPSRRIGGATLQSGLDAYIKVMHKKGRSPRSIEGVVDLATRLLKPWLEERLVDLGRDRRRVIERHDIITTKHGPYAANQAMRALRAIYNEAMRVDPDLPANPVRAVTFNREHRRSTAMAPDDLAGWWKQLSALSNPIRQEFHLFTLLSGSRPDALRKARWEHVDVRRRVLHIPNPKGGARRAFDIPLSKPMLRSLWRVRRAGRQLHPHASQDWIFASASPAGHIVEHKECRKKLAKWGGDLRQTFRTMAAVVGIDPLSSRLLMNHTVDRDVHDGYITKAALMGTLLGQQERLSAAIVARCEGRAEASRPERVVKLRIAA